MGWAAVHLPQNETAVKSQYLHKIDSRLLRVIPAHRSWHLADLNRRESSSMGAGPAGGVVRPMEQTFVNAFAALSRARNTINKQVASAAGGHQPLPPLQNFMSGYISAEAYFCLKALTGTARVGPSSMDLPMYSRKSQESRWHGPSSPPSPRCSCTGHPMFSESLGTPSMHHNAFNPSTTVDSFTIPSPTFFFAEALRENHVHTPRREGAV